MCFGADAVSSAGSVNASDACCGCKCDGDGATILGGSGGGKGPPPPPLTGAAKVKATCLFTVPGKHFPGGAGTHKSIPVATQCAQSAPRPVLSSPDH